MIEQRRYRRKRLWTRPRVLLGNLLSGWPFLVWLAAAGVVVWLSSGGIHYGQLTGVVDTNPSEVGPPQTSRLLSVDVAPGQRVVPGDVLARMDARAVDAAIAADEAAARARLEAAAGDDASALRMLRQLEADEADARADLAAARLAAARDEARLGELRRELTRRESLLASRMIREEDVAALRADVAELSKAVENAPALVGAHQARIDQAAAGRREVLASIGVGAGETPVEAVARRAREREAAVAELMRRRDGEREMFVLRAATTGFVSRIDHVPGNVVPAGSTIVRVVGADSRTIIGFLEESQLLVLSVGDHVTAWRKNVPGSRVTAVVTAISPDVQPLPARLGAVQNTAPRGRRVMMRVTSPEPLVPGETVYVELDRMRWIDRARQALESAFNRRTADGPETGAPDGSGTL